jgi:hypothetical protein
MMHQPYSAFYVQTISKDILPDSTYAVCGEDTQAQYCDVCSNEVWSQDLNAVVHDTQRGKVFCPFGKGDSMNQNIFNDQSFKNQDLRRTPFGMAPQMDPRPLSKIGLSWRTS